MGVTRLRGVCAAGGGLIDYLKVLCSLQLYWELASALWGASIVFTPGA